LEFPVENIEKPVITNLSERDAKVVWHPFTQHHTAPFSIPIVRAEGCIYLMKMASGTSMLFRRGGLIYMGIHILILPKKLQSSFET
jgi:hypothetical protein